MFRLALAGVELVVALRPDPGPERDGGGCDGDGERDPVAPCRAVGGAVAGRAGRVGRYATLAVFDRHLDV